MYGVYDCSFTTPGQIWNQPNNPAPPPSLFEALILVVVVAGGTINKICTQVAPRVSFIGCLLTICSRQQLKKKKCRQGGGAGRRAEILVLLAQNRAALLKEQHESPYLAIKTTTLDEASAIRAG